MSDYKSIDRRKEIQEAVKPESEMNPKITKTYISINEDAFKTESDKDVVITIEK